MNPRRVLHGFGRQICSCRFVYLETAHFLLASNGMENRLGGLSGALTKTSILRFFISIFWFALDRCCILNLDQTSGASLRFPRYLLMAISSISSKIYATFQRFSPSCGSSSSSWGQHHEPAAGAGGTSILAGIPPSLVGSYNVRPGSISALALRPFVFRL
jgi:hypothetical protein